MTFVDLIDHNAGKQSIRERVALRWLSRRCRRDPDFAAAFAEEVADQMVLHVPASQIDWSQIDWEQVVKIVLMILAAFGVL